MVAVTGVCKGEFISMVAGLKTRDTFCVLRLPSFGLLRKPPRTKPEFFLCSSYRQTVGSWSLHQM